MQKRHFGNGINSAGRSEATSEICANPAVNLWTVAAGFSAVRAVEYPFYDGNGNITDWMDADGALVAHHEYDPYGNETTGNPPASFGLSTKSLDPTLHLYYYGYRFYRPDWGRWLNRDPIGELDGPQIYGFAINNSLFWIDPFGSSITESQCESARDNALQNNAKVKLLIKALNDNGCPIPQIACECCSFAGTFDPDIKNIKICYNNAMSSGYIMEVLVHELVHAYDDCTGLDWSDCEERACSEIRAANYDGGCRKGVEARKKYATYQDCVKGEAALSTSVDPACGDGTAAVAAVFKRCFQGQIP